MIKFFRNFLIIIIINNIYILNNLTNIKLMLFFCTVFYNRNFLII